MPTSERRLCSLNSMCSASRQSNVAFNNGVESIMSFSDGQAQANNETMIGF